MGLSKRGVTSGPLFPKFLSGVPEVYDELRKRGSPLAAMTWSAKLRATTRIVTTRTARLIARKAASAPRSPRIARAGHHTILSASGASARTA